MITRNHPSTVDFVVSTESVQAVVTLLLSNQISFTLTSSNTLEAKPVQKATNTNDRNSELELINPESEHEDIEPPFTKNLAIWDDVIKKIYRKYLIDGIEQIPPAESQIAQEYKIPLYSLKNSFKEMYGKPFYQLYMDKRMEYAAKLLKRGFKAVEVSKRVGYGEKSCIKFNKMFQKHFGITPKKYQLTHWGRIDRRVG